MKSTVNGIARVVMSAGVLASALLLASCGGGTGTLVQTFVANRVIAFGDESSLITVTQKKYSVNALATDSTTELNCAANPIWVQLVADYFNHMVFPQCAGTVVDPVSRIRATEGATVADLAAQIDRQINLYGGFTGSDLVTVLVGTNDVVALFNQYPQVSQNDLVSAAQTAGLQLAAQVNRLADLGPRVLISTIPTMGLTPLAGDRAPGYPGPNSALLTSLSTAFNNALLARMTNDGRRIGLIQLDQYVLSLDNARAANTGNFANTTSSSCTVALPDCTTLTQVPEALVVLWLWADNVHLGPNGQAGLASLAISRIQTNPF
jgi:lysophospholipase L1-like esterase